MLFLLDTFVAFPTEGIRLVEVDVTAPRGGRHCFSKICYLNKDNPLDIFLHLILLINGISVRRCESSAYYNNSNGVLQVRTGASTLFKLFKLRCSIFYSFFLCVLRSLACTHHGEV